MYNYYEYPHTDLNQQNLDWVIKKVKENESFIDDMEGVISTIPHVIKTEIEKMIDDGVITVDSVLHTLSGIGCAGDGMTDNSAILNAFIGGLTSTVVTPIIVDSGTYVFSDDITIPPHVFLVFAGGIIAPTENATFTFNGYFDAPLKQCFSGNGSVVFVQSTSEVYNVYPEWWGAKNNGTTDCTIPIQKAIDSISRGSVILQPGSQNFNSSTGTWTPSARCYHISSRIEIRKSNICMKAQDEGSKAVLYSTSVPLLCFGSGNATSRIEESSVKNIKFIYGGIDYPTEETQLDNHNVYACEFKGCERTELRNLTVMGTPNAFVFDNTIGMKCYRLTINPAIGNTYNIARGYFIDNTTKNWSLYMDKCGGSFYAAKQSGTVGMYINDPTGGSATDMFFRDMEFANADIALKGIFSAQGYDILFDNPVFDQCWDSCVVIDGSSTTNIRFANGYFQHNNDGDAAFKFTGSFSKYMFVNCTFYDRNKTLETISAPNSGHQYFDSCVFQDCGYIANIYNGWFTNCYIHNTGNTALTCMIRYSNSNGVGGVTNCRLQNQSSLATLDYYIHCQQYVGVINNSFSGTHTAYFGGTKTLIINPYTSTDNTIPGFTHA